MSRGVEVREAIRIVEEDGWVLVRTRGIHRQFRHSTRPGTVTIPGSMKKVLHPKTWNSILKQAGISKERR
jgi:predicted RNA binding protein YcfA (HicA-like mRNA interferase family)